MFEVKSGDDFKVYWKPLIVVLGGFWGFYFYFVEDLTTHLLYFSLASGTLGVTINELSSWYEKKLNKVKN